MWQKIDMKKVRDLAVLAMILVVPGATIAAIAYYLIKKNKKVTASEILDTIHLMRRCKVDSKDQE